MPLNCINVQYAKFMYTIFKQAVILNEGSVLGFEKDAEPESEVPADGEE